MTRLRQCQLLLLPLLASLVNLTNASTTGPVAPRRLKPVILSAIDGGVRGSNPSLADQQQWDYGIDGAFTQVSITGTFGDSHQKVICMDRFIGLIKSTTCSENRDSIVYTLVDTAAFESVKKEWTWVNEKEAHNFILTVHEADCLANTNDARQVYQVTSVTWDDKKLTAVLTVLPKTWEEVLGDDAPDNTWEVLIDTLGIPSVNSHRKRLEVDRKGAIDLSHDFSGKIFADNQDNVTVDLDCAECHTDGSLDFQLRIVPFVFPPRVEGFAQLEPNNVGATAVIAFNSSGPLTEPLRKNVDLATFNLPGSFTAGPITVGPTIHLGVSTGFESISDATSALFGVKMSIPEESTAKVDFEDSGNNQFNGWNPQFEPVEPQIQNPFNTSIVVTPQIVVALEVTAFGLGVSAGLNLFAPELIIDAQLQTPRTAQLQTPKNTTSSGCGDGKGNTGSGFCIGLDIGAELDAFAGFGAPADLPGSLQLFSTKANVFSTCLPMDGGARPTKMPTKTYPLYPTGTGRGTAIGTGTGSPRKTTCITLTGKPKETGRPKRKHGSRPVEVVECLVLDGGEVPIFPNTTIHYERPGRMTMPPRVTHNTVL